MRKQLTPTEKLYVIREAKKLYLARKVSHFLCVLIRDCINGGKTMEEAGEDFVYSGSLPDYMPELYEYKPSHKDEEDAWWPAEAVEPRLAVLYNLEARYYGQTTWWSRMGFKIRNSFKRRFH